MSEQEAQIKQFENTIAQLESQAQSSATPPSMHPSSHSAKSWRRSHPPLAAGRWLF